MSDVDSILQQAFALMQRQQLPEAIAALRHVIAIAPDQMIAYQALGDSLLQYGNPAEAVEPLSRLVQLAPQLSGGWMLLGRALAGSGDRNGALDAYGRVVQLAPRASGAMFAIGEIEFGYGRLLAAIPQLQAALVIEANNPAIHSLLARVFTGLGRHEESLNHHRRAAELMPGVDAAINNLGIALYRAGRIGEAETQLRKATATAIAMTNLGSVLREQGRATEARECYERAMLLKPESSEINSIYLYLLHFDPAFDEAAIQAEHRKWAAKHLSSLPKIHKGIINRAPDRKLRVGYVSADFRQHVVGRFIEPILKNHDRNQFEIFCYSDTTASDDLTARLRASADHWWDTAGENDEQLAQLVAADRIDILLDTTGHMEGNRLLMFARQPAPVQISHIGYPAGSGVRQIQFRITDRHLDPAPIRGADETLLYLPGSFYLYANEIDLPAQPSPMIANGFVTFGSLNSPAKISDRAITLWASAMHAVPGSKFLLVLPPDGSVNGSVNHRFLCQGIDPSRLILEPIRSFEQYLKLYNLIDIALDPQPYGGGITSCDAFWMGVPIVTLSGKTSVGRIGATLLRNLGLDDLVASNAQEYAAIAARLSADGNRLLELRQTLRQRLVQSPLMDSKTYTRNLEELYRQAWNQFCDRSVAP